MVPAKRNGGQRRAAPCPRGGRAPAESLRKNRKTAKMTTFDFTDKSLLDNLPPTKELIKHYRKRVGE